MFVGPFQLGIFHDNFFLFGVVFWGIFSLVGLVLAFFIKRRQSVSDEADWLEDYFFSWKFSFKITTTATSGLKGFFKSATNKPET